MAIIAETSPEFLEFFFACQYAGLIPVPLPLSVNFGGREAYEERLRGMLGTAQARVAIASEELIATLRSAAAGTAWTWSARPMSCGRCQPRHGLASARRRRAVLHSVLPAAPACPAGSWSPSRRSPTTPPRSPSTVSATGADRCVSWLPLYHDMGLVGCCLTPVMTQVTVDYIATTGFARRPLTWLKVITEQRGTISFAPTFGYELCARRAPARIRGFDLSSWRVAGVGGEMIRVRALQEFAERFAPAGFRRYRLPAQLRLAEATLAVTFSPGGGRRGRLGALWRRARARSAGGSRRAGPRRPDQSRARVRRVRAADAGLPGRDPR